jgi:selenocysteine lyase/cysteine desulfurase
MVAIAEHKTGSRVAETPFHEAERAFLRTYPDYVRTSILDDLRVREYARLDRAGHTYLDYTGGALYAESQVRDHLTLLRELVLGNPHSSNPTSQTSTRLMDAARAAVLRFVNASPEEYSVVFTANASGALKLVGEAYPFGPGGHYALTADNHNSVNGIREFARAKHAAISYVPVRRTDLRVDEAALAACLDRAPSGAHRLLAYPAQSNFSGVQHDLDWVPRAQARGWDVLLDCAAYAPTNRLDLQVCRPDFVPLSFYKLFGYPTGVGCLIARKAALATLRRPWFAGGTITLASVLGDGHYLAPDAEGFEDGTVNYSSLPAVTIGLEYLARIGMTTIHTRVTRLTGWLLDALAELRHANGRPLVRVLGPTDTYRRGGTVTVNFYDAAGRVMDCQRIEQRANAANISLRTGCFCNPGAAECAFGLTRADIADYFHRDTRVTHEQFVTAMRDTGRPGEAVRISLGLVSTFADVYRFIRFAQGFLT